MCKALIYFDIYKVVFLPKYCNDFYYSSTRIRTVKNEFAE